MREIKIEESITGNDLASIRKYLKEIRNIPLLSIEEEIRLTRLARSGDVEALEKLIKGNLRFVVSIAKKYQHRGLSLGDLISEGNLGLISAAKRFDETKGFKFISFAVWWIRQSILLAIPEQTRTIRLPLNVISVITKINKTISVLEQRFERLPTAEEIAEEIDTKEEIISTLLEKAPLSYSLDAVWSMDFESTLLDLLHHPGSKTDYLVTDVPQTADIHQMFRQLSKREAKILTLFFGLTGKEPVTLEDISISFNLSRERIRQLKDSGLHKLRLNPVRQIKRT